MPVATSPDHEWEYVLREERGTDSPTVFILGVLSATAEAAIEDALVQVHADRSMSAQTGTQTANILRAGLRGWRNFRDARGTDVPFPTSKGRMLGGRATVTDEGLTMLAPKHRKELAEAITERNELTDDDRKNSSSAPAS